MSVFRGAGGGGGSGGGLPINGPIATYLAQQNGTPLDPNLPAAIFSADPGAPVNVAIPAAGSSVKVDLGAFRLQRLSFPAGFTWTTAALTLQAARDQASFDANAFNDLLRLNDDGSTTQVGFLTAAAMGGGAGAGSASLLAGRSPCLPVDVFFNVRFLRIVSGTGAAPVNQPAARNFQLITVAR